MSERPTQDAVFMAVAQEVARRATCPRASVGCVLVAGGQILSTGYNGAPSGAAHCTDAGCWMVDGHCRRALHAELNAAMRLGGRRAEVAYVTHLPCLHCVQALHLVGVRKVFYLAAYRMDAGALAQMREIYGIDFQEVAQ